jgi:peptidoglycan hydrolase CwlO-like protein
VAAAVALPASTHGDLSSQYQTHKQQADQLQSRINAESTRIHAFDGTIASLQKRLSAVQQSVALQERLLAATQTQLYAARARLHLLEHEWAHDRSVLAAQLVRDYEAPAPGVVNVVIEANGFQDLLNRLADMSAVDRANTRVIQTVKTERAAVEVQARRLAAAEAQRQRAATAVLDERDQIARLKLSVVDKELPYARARSADTQRLKALQKALTHEAHVLDQQAAQTGFPSGGVAPPAGGCVNTPFVAHGGEWGLFLAPGTNYTVNEEPVIAARLDALGKALHLHLIGISGYRSPQHSVEVGGFADDPHTRGEASDTPGVEGVPEAVLLEFCLTRPFPGPAEADHIQES